MYFFTKQVLYLLSMPLFLGIVACNSNKESSPIQRKEKVTIAAAANVQFALKAIEKAFEESTNIEVNVVIGSSGKLTAQIKQGAPYDIFIAANLKYPQDLYKSGFATSPPKIYALGSLVLWTMNKDIELSADLSSLTMPSIKHIGIANPKNAPYGAQAIAAINYYQLQDVLQKKLVYGESIAQVNQYVMSQNCEIGITAKSIVVAPKLQHQGKWKTINQLAYEPITQGAVITSFGHKNHQQAANIFYDFLSSQQAQQIFLDYGYNIPTLQETILDSIEISVQ